MGNIVMPSGQGFWTSEVMGSQTFSSLVSDAACVDYTNSYRRSLLKAIYTLIKLSSNDSSYLVHLPQIHAMDLSNGFGYQDEELEQLRKNILARMSANFEYASG